MFDAPPEAFGSYRVQENIGAGRFGPVYRAQDDATGVVAAVKVFDQGLTAIQAAGLAEALDRLCKAPLDHPSIVPCLAAGALGDRAWIAEAWIDATPLDEIMRRDGPQAFDDVLLRITRIAGALDFAAAVGLHHGALHPREILVSDRTMLTGLGVLQALGDAGLDVPMEGAYVSAQRAHGDPVTARDDIFSLAAILYELVYGTPVPERSGLRASMTPLTGVDHSRFADILERSLSPDPADRPSTALELAAAVQQVMVESAVESPRIPTPVPESDYSSILRSERFSDLSTDSQSDSMPMAPPLALDSPPAMVADLPLRTTSIGTESELQRNPNPNSNPNPNLNSNFNSIPNLNSNSIPNLNSNRESRSRNPESESESGYWFPIAAALAIGILTGFASGFVVGQRDSTPAPTSAERPVARSQRAPASDETPAPTAGRDFTESTVPPNPVTERPIVPAPAAPPAATPRPGSVTPQPGSAATPQPRSTPQAGPLPQEPSGRAQERPEEPSVRSESSGPGTLEVDSRPRGARVFVDGRLVGTTPLLVGEVRPGAHAVRIDLSGHRRWVTNVDVAPGGRHRVAASLER